MKVASAKLQLVTPTDPASSERAQSIDRLGALQSILDDYSTRISPYKAEADAIEAQLLESYLTEAPSLVRVEEGQEFLAKISACQEKQEADVPARKKIIKIIGVDAYIALCRPTLEQLKSALTPAQYDQFVRKLRVGRRNITVVRKAAPEIRSAAA